VARKTSLVLSGGVALGAYQAGAYEVLHEHEDLRPERLAGSSIGAVNGAVIAGNAPEERVRTAARVLGRHGDRAEPVGSSLETLGRHTMEARVQLAERVCRHGCLGGPVCSITAFRS
jgi:NTE family protein